MKKNIVLAGLPYTENLGDVAIFECIKKYIESFFEKQDMLNIEIRAIDLSGATYIGEKIKEKEDISQRLVEQMKETINNYTQCIIIVGGGLIKYIYQEELPMAVGMIIDYAKEVNIPVMLSAIGIEGYSNTSIVCKDIVRFLNQEQVKVMTTRDDLFLLTNEYIKNKNIITGKVADPACSINYFYSQNQKQENLIGLGVTRRNLFLDNGMPYDVDMLLELWGNIYYKLIKQGKKCKIFTNGLQSDQRFAALLCEYLELDKNEFLLPRPNSVKELIGYITSFEGIIATRLHCAIIAYAYHIPVVELVWNIKQKYFGKSIGYPERFIDSERFEADYIINVLFESIKQGYDIQRSEEYKKSTWEYIDNFLTKYING